MVYSSHLNRMIYPIIFILSFLTFKPCLGQEKFHKIFPYITQKISFDSISLCLTKDESRYGLNHFYSLFLLYNYSVLDSLSLDQYSNTGSEPKSFFIWETKDKKYGCLEYNTGAGIGYQLMGPTTLFIFDLSGRKIVTLLSTIADSTDFDSFSKEGLEVHSRILPYDDTLFIMRTAWKINGKDLNIKTREWNSTTSIVSKDGKLFLYSEKGLPYFMQNHKKERLNGE